MKTTTRKLYKSKKTKTIAGFSVLELLAVFAIGGVMMTIMIPNFLKFVNQQRLISSHTAVYSAIKQAQSQAKSNKLTWRASFRQNGNTTEWAVDRLTAAAPTSWKSLETNVGIDYTNSYPGSGSPQIFTLGFDYNGNFFPAGTVAVAPTSTAPLGRITLRIIDPASSPARRCVTLTTLIGGMTSGKDTECN